MSVSYDTEAKREALERAVQSLSGCLIPPSRLKYEKKSVLGRGGFGEVALAHLQEGRFFQTKRTPVAVKTLLPNLQDPVRVALRFTREVTLWKRLDHANVLRLLGFYLDLKDLRKAYIVSPYLKHGSIKKYLVDNIIDPRDRFPWVEGMTEGLAYLHSLVPPVVHGDLKADNVLLNDDLDPVLCDFGLSALAEGSPSSGLTTSDGFKGSIRWCSPEVIEGEPRDLASDVWAWALTVIEIMTQKAPFWNERTDFAVIKRITDGKWPHQDEYPDFPLDGLLWPILSMCLASGITQRPTISNCRTALGEIKRPREMRKLENLPFSITGNSLTPAWEIEFLVPLIIVPPNSKDAALVNHLPADLVRLSPQGTLMAVERRFKADCVIELWDLESGRRLWSHLTSGNGLLLLKALEFNADQTYLAYMSGSVLEIVSVGNPSNVVSHQVDKSYRGFVFFGNDLLLWADQTLEHWKNPTSTSRTIKIANVDYLFGPQGREPLPIKYALPSPSKERLLVIFGGAQNSLVVVWNVISTIPLALFDQNTPILLREGRSLGSHWLSDAFLLIEGEGVTKIHDLNGESNKAPQTFETGQLQRARIAVASPQTWVAFWPDDKYRLYRAAEIIAAHGAFPEDGALDVSPEVVVHGVNWFNTGAQLACQTLLLEHSGRIYISKLESKTEAS